MIDKENITIIVVSYNSFETICETLNSIVNQNFPKEYINLIITDDCSTDMTLDLVNKWMVEHINIFSDVKIITSEKNKGVSANINKALFITNTKWVKLIAADDRLMPNCIKSNFDFINKNPDATLICSKVKYLINDKIVGEAPDNSADDFFKLGASEQYKMLLVENNISAPTMFMSLSTLKQVGYMNECYEMIEDYPLWLKCTSLGYPISFNDDFTVIYSISDSLSRQLDKIGNLRFLESNYKFKKEMVWPHWKGIKLMIRMCDEIIEYYEKRFAISLFNNKKTKSYIVYKFIISLIRPYYVLNKVRSSEKLNKDL